MDPLSDFHTLNHWINKFFQQQALTAGNPQFLTSAGSDTSGSMVLRTGA